VSHRPTRTATQRSPSLQHDLGGFLVRRLCLSSVVGSVLRFTTQGQAPAAWRQTIGLVRQNPEGRQRSGRPELHLRKCPSTSFASWPCWGRTLQRAIEEGAAGLYSPGHGRLCLRTVETVPAGSLSERRTGLFLPQISRGSRPSPGRTDGWQPFHSHFRYVSVSARASVDRRLMRGGNPRRGLRLPVGRADGMAQHDVILDT
jgi:hypothetical protein